MTPLFWGIAQVDNASVARSASGAGFDWAGAAQIAQVVATLLSGIGVIVSIALARKALGEARSDRIHRVRPKLLFNHGGQAIGCELIESRGLMGKDPTWAAQFFTDQPTGAKHTVPTTLWGGLRNLGAGAAMRVSVTFVSRSVTKAGEAFEIGVERLSEFPYTPWMNRIPIGVLAPGEEGQLLRIPVPIEVDITGQVTLLKGFVVIDYEDIYGTHYQTAQAAHFVVQRDSERVELLAVFDAEIDLDSIRPFLPLVRPLGQME